MSRPVATERGEFVRLGETDAEHRRRWFVGLESISGLRTCLVQGGPLHLADLVITSNDDEKEHLRRVREALAAPAAVRLALAVMELVKTGGARQVAPGARITLAPGDWDRLTLLAHEAAKALEGRS